MLITLRKGGGGGDKGGVVLEQHNLADARQVAAIITNFQLVVTVTKRVIQTLTFHIQLQNYYMYTKKIVYIEK
jgi:hypothetical protein